MILRNTIDITPIQVTVIDNYGHGRAGVTLSWGCGQHVARLFKEAVDMLRNSRIA